LQTITVVRSWCWHRISADYKNCNVCY